MLFLLEMYLKQMFTEGEGAAYSTVHITTYDVILTNFEL